MTTIERDEILKLRGEDLYDNHGEKIGSIEEIYLDDETGKDAPGMDPDSQLSQRETGAASRRRAGATSTRTSS
jgi:hypothetical protein